jgi:hypothetical protein
MRKLSIVTIAILALAGAIHCPAQQHDKGYWRAASNSAVKITGDIAISDSKLTLNLHSYPLASIRNLLPVEVSAVFDADVNTAGQGTLYRLKIPAELKLQHHNTLCGSDETQWMATYLSGGKSLEVAFFSGDDVPVFTIDKISNSTTLCGTFSFAR